jgi:hypothetical protein
VRQSPGDGVRVLKPVARRKRAVPIIVTIFSFSHPLARFSKKQPFHDPLTAHSSQCGPAKWLKSILRLTPVLMPHWHLPFMLNSVLIQRMFRWKNLLYCHPSIKQWGALCICLGIILACSLCGLHLLPAILPFLFFSSVGLGLSCFDILKPGSRKQLKWDGIVWLLIMFITSLSCFFNLIESVRGILDK